MGGKCPPQLLEREHRISFVPPNILYKKKCNCAPPNILYKKKCNCANFMFIFLLEMFPRSMNPGSK